MNHSIDPKDMPALPPMNVLEIMLVDNDDFQPGHPWKTYDFHDDDLSRRNLNRVSFGNNDDSDVKGNHRMCIGNREYSKLI